MYNHHHVLISNVILKHFYHLQKFTLSSLHLVCYLHDLDLDTTDSCYHCLIISRISSQIINSVIFFIWLYFLPNIMLLVITCVLCMDTDIAQRHCSFNSKSLAVKWIVTVKWVMWIFFCFPVYIKVLFTLHYILSNI